jgi:Ras-related GTP-binding protein A/B
MGTLTLNLWDCGGQDTFMEQYFAVQRETIFRGVEVLIYVFDIEDKDEKLKKSLDYWRETLKSVSQYNDKAHIFCLIHKIDKVPLDERTKRIAAKKQ